MTLEKQKAIELVEKFGDTTDNWGTYNLGKRQAKQCAIICVDEILEILSKLHKPEYTTFAINDNIDGYELEDFYEKIKQEIQNLK